jgi:hypothetical protein
MFTQNANEPLWPFVFIGAAYVAAPAWLLWLRRKRYPASLDIGVSVMEKEDFMSKTFSRSDIYVKKTLAPPLSTVVGFDSDDLGYTAEYDGYSAVGDTEDEAIDKLFEKLLDKGYEEE